MSGGPLVRWTTWLTTSVPLFPRYEKFWLPLLSSVSKSPDTDLQFCPPLDVHWVWHVHMLCPTAYAADCTAVAGRVLGHALRPLADLPPLRDRTRRVWKDKFPDEPFDRLGTDDSNGGERDGLVSAGEGRPDFANGLVSKISYNIEAAVARQKVFYYQVKIDEFLLRSHGDETVVASSSSSLSIVALFLGKICNFVGCVDPHLAN